MQIRALIILVVALIMGLFAVFLANTFLQQKVEETAVQPRIKTRPVVAAALDIDTSTRLDAVMLKVVDWPESSVPEGAFNSVEDVIGTEAPIALKVMKKGEPVLAYKLSPHGARGGLPSKIPEDMRAVTIPVNEVTGVAGFVLPGNYVDVLHTTTVGRKDEIPVTRTLLQNIMVIGIDQISNENEDEPKVVNAVTMLVSPRDGKKLTLAQNLGTLKLLLRNEFDASIVKTTEVTYRDLLTPDEAPTKVVKRVRRPIVEVIRGLDIYKQRVKEGEGTEGTAAPAANE